MFKFIINYPKNLRFPISKKFLSNLTFSYFFSFKNLKDPEFQYFHEPYLLLLLTLINNSTLSQKLWLLFLKKIQVPFPDHNKFSAIFINLSLFQTFSVEYSIILSDSHKILTFGHYFSVSSPFVGWSNPGKRTNYVVLGRVEPCDTSLISSGPMWQAIDDESVQIISKHLS